jgi:hypothetical protein
MLLKKVMIARKRKVEAENRRGPHSDVPFSAPRILLQTQKRSSLKEGLAHLSRSHLGREELPEAQAHGPKILCRFENLKRISNPSFSSIIGRDDTCVGSFKSAKSAFSSELHVVVVFGPLGHCGLREADP